MTTVPALAEVFAASLGVAPGVVHDSLCYNSIPQWDSVAHMRLVMALEKAYGVMLEPEDILELSTPAKARIILGKLGVKGAI